MPSQYGGMHGLPHSDNADAQQPAPKAIGPKSGDDREKFYAKVRGLIRNLRLEHELGATPSSQDPGASFPYTTGHSVMSRGSRTWEEDLQSVSSINTSTTTFASIWDSKDGAEQQDKKKNPLRPILKAQKYLVRALAESGPCHHRCRLRKVTCIPSHFKFEMAFEGQRTEDELDDLMWAKALTNEKPNHKASMGILKEDSPMPDAPVANEFQWATNILDEFFDHSAVSNITYEPQIVIDEPEDDSTLDDSVDSVRQYTTTKLDGMLQLGYFVEKMGDGDTRVYQCLYENDSPGCCQHRFLSRKLLEEHYSSHDEPFIPLDDPLRLVCTFCGQFHTGPSGNCTRSGCEGSRHPLYEFVYGRKILNALTTSRYNPDDNQHHWPSNFQSSPAGNNLPPNGRDGPARGGAGHGGNDHGYINGGHNTHIGHTVGMDHAPPWALGPAYLPAGPQDGAQYRAMSVFAAFQTRLEEVKQVLNITKQTATPNRVCIVAIAFLLDLTVRLVDKYDLVIGNFSRIRDSTVRPRLKEPILGVGVAISAVAFLKTVLKSSSPRVKTAVKKILPSTLHVGYSRL